MRDVVKRLNQVINDLTIHTSPATSIPVSSSDDDDTDDDSDDNEVKLPQTLLAHLPPVLRRVLSQTVTGPTWKARARVAQMWADSLKHHSSFEHTLARLMKRRLATVQPTTVSKDLSALKWLLPFMPPEQMPQHAALLTELQKGLRRMASDHRPMKAVPIALPEVVKLMKLLPAGAAALLNLCWVTASRIGDAMNLTAADCELTPRGLLVRFRSTKTNPEAQPRADHFAVIGSPAAVLLEHLKCCGRGPIFSRSHLRALDRGLRLLPVPPSRWTSATRTRFSRHSIKRGAAQVLWQQAASGAIPPSAVQHLLKHRSIDTTLAYCPHPEDAAVAFRTHIASEMLRTDPL